MKVKDGLLVDELLDKLTKKEISHSLEQLTYPLPLDCPKWMLQVLNNSGIVFDKVLLINLPILLHPYVTSLVCGYRSAMT